MTQNGSVPLGMNWVDCQMAKEVVLNPFAQFVRLIMLLFNTIPCLLFPFLVLEYRRYRLALHPNLKLIYINIAFLNVFLCLGSFFVEFRHIYFSLFDPIGAFPCAMLCPLWYALASRGSGFLVGTALPFFHLFAMLERWRATAMAKNYEKENICFGVFGAITIYAISLAFFFFFVQSVLLDYDWNWGKMLAYNSMVTKRSNPLAIFGNYASLATIGLTAIGDYVLIVKNKRRRRQAIELNDRNKEGYSLSENYQLHENLLAMRYILPLDVAYVLSISLYSVLSIILRSYQPQMAFPVFLANYNLITCLTILCTTISFVYFRRYLLWNGSGGSAGKRHRQKLASEVAPSEQLGQLYFQQLQTQWNGKK